LGLCSSGAIGAAEKAAKAAGPDPQQYQQVVSKALAFLEKSQDTDGSYSKQAGVGITALVATAMLQNGRSPDDPVVARSLKCLEGFVQKDGGIYTPDSMVRNYETSIAVMCLSAANKDKRYEKRIRAAEKYLKQTQWTEATGKEKSDMFYGGAGYGKHKRPDLSNTAFMVEALKSCGNGPDDEAIQKALVFVSRCQNLETEHNTTPMASKNPDGGFYYTPVGKGESMAGATANGGLRSYASMTYSGLKSMLYAGVKADDPRVKAAVKWASMNYGLSTNPGLGGEGLFYYYHVFAKALATMGLAQIEDAQGVKHDWKRELVEELAKRQRPNGSWINPTSRWLESDPNLVTSYALLALAYCK
jgi:squalene-hopene/tetraprenyl-beta-curcumene cyclase